MYIYLPVKLLPISLTTYSATKGNPGAVRAFPPTKVAVVMTWETSSSMSIPLSLHLSGTGLNTRKSTSFWTWLRKLLLRHSIPELLPLHNCWLPQRLRLFRTLPLRH
jgi:hypothetical protein